MTTASATLIACNESPPVLGKYADCGYTAVRRYILLDTRALAATSITLMEN